MTSAYEWQNPDGLDRDALEDVAPDVFEADYTPPRHRYRTVVHLNHRYAEGIYA